MTDTATNDGYTSSGAKYIVNDRCEKQLILLVYRYQAVAVRYIIFYPVIMYDQSKDTYHHFKLTTRSMSQSWYCSINRNGCVLNTSVWKQLKHTGTAFR
jgi:hypothetical protein